jgi:hypothetical protein
MCEPIENRSELDETEKRDGQLFVTSRDPAVAFDAGEVIFDRVSVSIEPAVEAIGNASGVFWRDADHRSTFRIEGLVGDRPVTVQPDLEWLTGSEVMLLAGSEVEPDNPADAVDHSRELRIEPAFRASHRLPSLPANWIGTVAMNLDVRAVHTADPAKRRSTQLGENIAPEAAGTPSSESSIDRAPRTESLWKVPPGNTGSKNIPHGGDHASVILMWPASFVTIGPLPFSGTIGSIFLAAPRAARATPSDL